MNALVLKDIPFGVFSEVGQLNAVLLHRPGDELKRLTEINYKHFLFDSIPCLIETQKSYDLFTKYLSDHQIQIYYVKDLLYESFQQSNEARKIFIQEILQNSSHVNNKIQFKSNLTVFFQDGL